MRVRNLIGSSRRPEASMGESTSAGTRPPSRPSSSNRSSASCRAPSTSPTPPTSPRSIPHHHPPSLSRLRPHPRLRHRTRKSRRTRHSIHPAPDAPSRLRPSTVYSSSQTMASTPRRSTGSFETSSVWSYRSNPPLLISQTTPSISPHRSRPTGIASIPQPWCTRAPRIDLFIISCPPIRSLAAFVILGAVVSVVNVVPKSTLSNLYFSPLPPPSIFCMYLFLAHLKRSQKKP